MNAFGFYEPTSVRKAVAIAADHSEGKYVAGGQTLLAAMKLGLATPSDLVDLGKIPELAAITYDKAADAVVVGSMAKHAQVAASSEIASRIPALAHVAGLIGDVQVRNRGTLGGSIANNDPAADYPAAVLGLGATIVTDQRKIAADEFFKGLFETALNPNELITSVSFPVPKRAAYMKFRNPASRFAVVGVFVAQAGSGIRVAVTGAGSAGVFRVKAMEDALAKNWSPDAVKSIAVPASGLQTDIHASAEYRAHLITVLAQRAIAAA
ncbi:MAG TPA: xanthine dehydrogenase family protein subunit M [Usitatibacter sp.]|nr:xanthine dehydrogenase family protein subunit M [Usitatibacter sp.]